jgi:cell pole-organizing protein PopZ
MSNPPPPHATQDGADPSMEDILASIRRILNDDEVPAAPVEAVSDVPAKPDVLVLDESMMIAVSEPASEPPHVEPPKPEPEPEPVPVAAFEPDPEPLPAAAEAMPPYPEIETMTSSPQAAAADGVAPTSDLLAPETAAAAASSVDSLVRKLTSGRGPLLFGGGPTLEDLVRSELRPMLKEWLDAHLPPIVERLVRIEIEKVVGRADF